MGIEFVLAVGGMLILLAAVRALKGKGSAHHRRSDRGPRATPTDRFPFRKRATQSVDARPAQHEREFKKPPSNVDRRQYTYIARKPLHPLEQELYWKLRLAVPSYSVLPQVALSQIVEPVPNIYEAWNPIAQKVVDFLVLRRDFMPLCVIELDGRHHQEEKQLLKDGKRDAALAAAGITVIRWTMRTIPTSDEIARLIKSLDSHRSDPPLR